MSFYNDADFNFALRSLLDSSAALRADWAALKFEIALRRAMAAEAKYNPNWRNQPRVPAGTTGGGQWVGGGIHLFSPRPPTFQRIRDITPSTPGEFVLPEEPIERGDGKINLPLRLLGRLAGPVIGSLGLAGDTPQPKVTVHTLPGVLDLVLVHIDRRATGGQSAYFARVVDAGVKEPFKPFGIETPLSFDSPATTRRLDVAVTIIGGEARFDPKALAKAYGREIPGVTSQKKPGDRGFFRVVPGSGLETLNGEEASFAAALRAQGRTNREIQTAIESRRSSPTAGPSLAIHKRKPPLGSPIGSLSYKVGENEIVLTPVTGSDAPYDVEFVIRRDYGSLPRNSNVRRAQREAGESGLLDDEGFHTAAHRFFPGLEETILPGNKTLNRGAWRAIENTIGKHTKKGNVVRGTIKLRPSRSRRPAEFQIGYQVSDGADEVVTKFEKTVKNEIPE